MRRWCMFDLAAVEERVIHIVTGAVSVGSGLETILF